ncbi:MAG: hypothetical protein ACK5MT_17465 [Actinomycetales bacterium]
MDDLDQLLKRARDKQFGVVARPALIRAGVSDTRIRGRLERAEWQRLLPGVYLVHSGPVPWPARAHGSLLYAGEGAALGMLAAAHAHGMVAAAPRVIDVWVPKGRNPRSRPGVRIHRRDGLVCLCHGLPRRTIPEQTVLDVAAGCRDPDAVVAILTAALNRDAAPARIASLLAASRHRWRALLNDLVCEPGEGIESPLEWRYRRDVERSHGLPSGLLQTRELLPSGAIRADVRYPAYGYRVELDGRLAHRERLDADLWRDNEVNVFAGERTLRYRWSHVAGRPCETAAQVATALRRGGWRGSARPCRRCAGVVAA